MGQVTSVGAMSRPVGSVRRRTGLASRWLALVLGCVLLAGSACLGADITERVSVASDGTQANWGGDEMSVSADGRYVAFVSSASNLVERDTNSIGDIFLHDRLTGETRRVNVASDGTQANYPGEFPSLSADGRYVAFTSYASNLVSGDTNSTRDTFVHDCLTGETTRVSVASDGTQANGESYHTKRNLISADGRYVVFASFATNLVSEDTNGSFDVFRRDRVTGETVRMSVASGGAQANGSSVSPSISADGRCIAFNSYASNLVPGDTNGCQDAFVHDCVTGETTRVSVASDGAQADATTPDAFLSPDGRYVGLWSKASNLVSGDTNGYYDSFVHDRLTGQTTRVSVASDGSQGDSDSYTPVISLGGRYTAFESHATTLVTGRTMADGGVYLHDGVTGATVRVDVAPDGSEPTGSSWWPAMSADGSSVAFLSHGANLVAGDTNGCSDTFVRSRHAVGVTIEPPGPTTVEAGGSVALSGNAFDTVRHATASWSWSDGGAGGSFAPSAEVQDPTYTAPANADDSPLAVTLTATATCTEGGAGSASALLAVDPVGHELHLMVSVTDATIPSGGVVGFPISFMDSRSDHTASDLTWAWSDGGAGGSFFPSASDPNPSYTAPLNCTDADIAVDIWASVTCAAGGGASASDAAAIMVQPVEHTFSVSGLASPPIVTSGGATTLSASATDSRTGHSVLSWSWSDGAAGGTFSPSAAVQDPGYTAPANASDTMGSITLTVAATCSGGGSDSNSLILSVQPADHALTVGAGASPAAVASGGSTSLSATAVDAQGHSIATWFWDDGGAGGSFTPSASAQDATYTAPANASDADRMVVLIATATCAGASPISGSGITAVTVQPRAHAFSVTVGPASPATVASGGSTSLSASATDSRTHSVTWSWSDVGAGGTFTPSAMAQNPTYTAAANTTDNDRAVALSVTGTCTGTPALSDTKTISLTVQPVLHQLQLSPSASPDVVASGGSAVLSAEVNDSHGHGIASWSWDDGGAGGSFSPSASVQSPTYTAPTNTSDRDLCVTLTVTVVCDGPDPLSVPWNTSVVVRSAMAPVAGFSGAPTRARASLTVSFSDLSSGAPTSWLWGFGDGSTSEEQNPTHTYTAPGTYAVSLTATNAGGSDTAFQPSYVTVSFADVAITPTDAADYWALDQILLCVDAGIVQGYDDGTYRPDVVVRRDQMAVYISRALADGEANVPSGPPTATFSDVPDSYWAYKYIEYAVDRAVVQGYDDNTYRPEVDLDRAQMAVFLARALCGGESSVPAGPATATFLDVATDFWAYKHVEYIWAQGVTMGYPQPSGPAKYQPVWFCTRDQMAVFVARAFLGLP